MKKVLLTFLVILTSLSLLAAFGCARPSKKGLVDNNQGITEGTEGVTLVSSTELPKGCASCHMKINGNKDYSLTTQLSNIEGHPPVEVTSVADCLNCHAKGDEAFSKGLHKRHYQGQNDFETKYDGSCVHCHKLSAGGQVEIPGLAPQGTKYVKILVANIDKSAGGCAGCHKKKYAVFDFNLKDMVNKIPDHPTINFENVNQCYDCHSKSSPRLEEVLHGKHLRNIVYQAMYGNSCLNCHQLQNDGSVKLKGRK